MMKNNKKMNILMIGPVLNGFGGISRVVRTWFEGNILKSFNVACVSTVSEDSRSRIIDLIKALSGFSRNSLNADLIYIHTSSAHSCYRKCIFLFLSYVIRKKVILHVHPAHFVDFLAELGQVKRMLVTALLRTAEAIVVLTPGIQVQLAEIFPDKKFYVMLNPVHVDMLANPANIKRKECQLLYLGWYNRNKGVYDLVDALEIVNEQNKDVKLKFFGTKEIEKLKSYVSSKGLNHVIEVNGWADDEEKIKALYESTCLILPSYTEGLPNVVLEAMATRTPVIATHVGGLKEILVPWVNAIIVEPGNPRDISEKITYLLDNKEKRDAIAEKAFEEVKNKYDVPIIRKRFAEILNEICN